MADNVQVNARQTDGAVFAADEISSVYYPRTKMVIGADGTNDGDVSATNPLPVAAAEKSGQAYDGSTACTVKRFHSANPSDGDSLIAAVASKKLRILSFGILSISGTICRFWLDDADAAAVFGNSTGLPLEEDSGAAPPGFILPHNPHGWFQTATANKALRIQFASGSGVVCFGTYIEVA